MLDKVKLHQKFSNWPLHITIVSWFEISNLEIPRLIVAIEKITADLKPIRITTTNINYYGRNNTIKVMEIKSNDELSLLRKKLIQTIETCKASPIEAYKDFKPHVTLNKYTQNLEKDNSFTLTKLLLVAKINDKLNQIVEELKF